MEGEAVVLLEDRNVERIERVDLVGNLGAAVSLLASAFAGLPIEFRSSRLRDFRVLWAELASVETGSAAATLTLHGGRRQRINLRRYHNGAEVARLLRESAAARGIPVSGEGAPAVAASLPAR